MNRVILASGTVDPSGVSVDNRSLGSAGRSDEHDRCQWSGPVKTHGIGAVRMGKRLRRCTADADSEEKPDEDLDESHRYQA